MLSCAFIIQLGDTNYDITGFVIHTRRLPLKYANKIESISCMFHPHNPQRHCMILLHVLDELEPLTTTQLALPELEAIIAQDSIIVDATTAQNDDVIVTTTGKHTNEHLSRALWIPLQ